MYKFTFKLFVLVFVALVGILISVPAAHATEAETITTVTTTGNAPSALSCSFLSYEQLTSIKNGMGADPEVVKALQEWLNSSQNAGLTVTGVYDQSTRFAVMLLQEKYASEVLHPWGIQKATGNVWMTTGKLIMKLACGENVPLPALVPFSG